MVTFMLLLATGPRGPAKHIHYRILPRFSLQKGFNARGMHTTAEILDI